MNQILSRVAALVSLCALAAFAQDVPPPRSPTAGSVADVGPEIYYLQDDAGRLVPVPGFRYRDFIDLMRLKDGLPGQPQLPAVVLETVTIVATLPKPTTEAAAARSCPAQVRLAVRQVRPGWVSVPIDLQGFLVAGAPLHDGPGQMFFTAAGDSEEATARLWFNAVPEGGDVRHTVTLDGAIHLESSLAADSVSVFVPPATASRVELRTPRMDPAVTVWPASLPPLVTPVDAADGEAATEAGAAAMNTGSLVTVVGAAGPLQVRIGDRRPSAGPISAVPEAMVESLVKVDGKTAVVEATLRLDGLPADTSTVRITLPTRTSLRGVREPATLVERTGTAESPIAVVRVDRDSAGAATVELECERTIDASGRTPFDPLGFAVHGIPDWRQRGRVSLIVDGDWQVEWSDAGGNRRIDAPPSARRPGFVAAFAYDSQPASLPLRVRSRGSRVVIEPEYRYDVGATRITLDGRLRVSVRGAAVSRLVVGLEGWEIDEVGPPGLIDTSAVTADAARMTLPFQQPLTGDAVIDFRCSRAIDRTADRVAWKFPAPEASLVGPAAVVIAGASDIELLPDATGLRGLVRQIAPAPLRSDVDRLALVYRLDGNEGMFQAQRRFLDRRIDASVRTQIDVQETSTYVTETIRFAVAHVPLEFVELLVPATVARSGSLEVRQGGQLLNPVVELPDVGEAEEAAEEDPVAEPQGENVGGSGTGAAANGAVSGLPGDTGRAPRRASIRALLPVPLLGSGEVSVTYEIPTPDVPPETTVAQDIPLVVPVDAKVGRQTLQVSSVEPLTVELRGEDWKRDLATPVGAATRSWTSTRFQDTAPVALAARRRESAGETIVEAAWLQTRLLPDRREDVAIYAIGTAAERITISLPEGSFATAAAVEVRLDGRRVDDLLPVEGRITVALPGGGRAVALLELRISRPWPPTPSWGMAGLERIVLEPPTFSGSAQLRRFYWELILPFDQHVIVPPLRWTGQQPWQWGTFGLERRPQVSRGTLLDWVRDNAGLSHEGRSTVLDADISGRRAVYAGVGASGTAVVWTAATWLLVLAASGPVLAAGLMLVYVPLARTTPVVIGLAGLVTMLAAAAPGLSPLVAQAAIPGVVLALAAMVMHGLIGPRGPSGPLVWSGSPPLRDVVSPSIIFPPSATRSPDSVTTPGRSAS